jgi:thioredoxin 1
VLTPAVDAGLAGMGSGPLVSEFCKAGRLCRAFARATRRQQATAARKGSPPMASELIKHVSDASFDSDVLKSGTPVLVDYWAEWCGPCKMIAPILDDVAGEYQGKLQIAKMNVDENRDVPAKFGIRGIPTLMLFKDGQLAATKVGALSKAQLTDFLKSHL